MNNNYLILMAGGIGSRFWPVSTPEQPKQFLDILGKGESLIQSTVNRFMDICPPENIYIVTNEDYKDIVKEQLPFLKSHQILLEPCMRNTAPCINYAARKIAKENKNAKIVVSPADHYIKDVKDFKEIINVGLDTIGSHDVLITIGIRPTYPATGYGYIEKSDNTIEPGIYKSKGFKEKPDFNRAKQYVVDGNYFWNSGIFIWSASSILSALKEFVPDIYNAFEDISDYFYSDQEQQVLNEVYQGCENISIDYAVMEKAQNVYVIPADFGWSDIGSWKSLYDLKEKDEQFNSKSNNVKFIESKGNYVNVSDKKRVIVQGAEDFMIIESDGVLLIAKLDQDQRIKEFSKIK